MRDAIRSKLASLLAIFRTDNETHDGNGNRLPQRRVHTKKKKVRLTTHQVAGREECLLKVFFLVVIQAVHGWLGCRPHGSVTR